MLVTWPFRHVVQRVCKLVRKICFRELDDGLSLAQFFVTFQNWKFDSNPHFLERLARCGKVWKSAELQAHSLCWQRGRCCTFTKTRREVTETWIKLWTAAATNYSFSSQKLVLNTLLERCNCRCVICKCDASCSAAGFLILCFTDYIYMCANIQHFLPPKGFTYPPLVSALHLKGVSVKAAIVKTLQFGYV